MPWFSPNWKAFRSFLGNAAPPSRRKFRTCRRATFETLSSREMLSASSGRMIAAHSLAISASLHAGQPAMVSACGHSSPTGSSAATLAAGHLANGERNNGAALLRLGTGTLTLSGAPHYQGGATTVTAGMPMVSGTNTFTGTTTTNIGTLSTWNSGITSQTGTGSLTLGSGALNLNVGTFNASMGTLIGGSLWQSGAATLETAGNSTLANNSSLIVSQGTTNFNSTYSGTLAVPVTAATATINLGATSLTDGSLWSSGAGTLNLAGNATPANYNLFSANAGTLRLNSTSGPDTILGPATIGAGVLVNNLGSAAASMTLAGTVSALSGSTSVSSNRVHTIALSSSMPMPDGSVTVAGTNQPIGAIDGSGDTTVNTGASLTANHIVQSALMIGGNAINPAGVTIAASDFSGSPLATSLLATGIPFESGSLGSPSLISTVGSDSAAV